MNNVTPKKSKHGEGSQYTRHTEMDREREREEREGGRERGEREKRGR